MCFRSTATTHSQVRCLHTHSQYTLPHRLVYLTQFGRNARRVRTRGASINAAHVKTISRVLSIPYPWTFPLLGLSSPLFPPFLHAVTRLIHSYLGTSLAIMVSPALKRKADISASSPAESKKPKGGSITSFFGAPKPKPGNTQSGNASSPPRPTSFNKEKWVASLKPEQKELLQLEIDTLDESWLAHLKDEIVTPEFLNLKRFLKKEKDAKAKVFPPEEDVYSWYLPFPPFPSSSFALLQTYQLTILLQHIQVPPHPPPQSKSSNCRPRPLPQRQPSPRPRLLRPPPNPRPTIASKHLQRNQKGIPHHLHLTPQQRRPPNPLGRAGRINAKHMSNCARPPGKQPLE